MSARNDRRTLVLGLFIMISGLFCLVSGITLLAWQIANPEQAARLPQAIIVTAEPTPTPGILGTALAPPPLPDNMQQIAMLPVSDDPSPTPGTVTQSATQPATQSITQSVAQPAQPTPTRTRVFFPPPRPTETYRQPVTADYATATPPTQTPTPVATRVAILPERVIIDRIELDAPIVPVEQHPLTIGDQLYSQWDVPKQRAAGWHSNSASLGVLGNLVLNGHHNIYGEVFSYLRVLKPGDLISLESDTRRYHYIVVQTLTLAEQDQPVSVRQENARWILPTDDERVTLITCWPPYANTHRLVVIARPIDDVIPPAKIP